eukprot:TRINITY_DN5419_c0_g1_i1.p1 TRINITY_DN5419_c0_g1~~TRINITY_DN5419_c0_g1_i1.p1  ORF type:complete len:200 (-),score=26.94 TRINITY_DN5419_c0_g1_i1:316-915(-)
MNILPDNPIGNVAIVGALRGMIGLPIEHPFDCIKTVSQNTHTMSLLSKGKGWYYYRVFSYIYASKGFFGLYQGFTFSYMRHVIKQTYRFPFMIFLPKFLTEHLPGNVRSEMIKGITGYTIASLEALFLTPLDRLKVNLMTQPAGSRFANLAMMKRQETFRSMLQSLYRGTSTVYFIGILSWCSFLVCDDFFKKKNETVP